MIVLGSAEPPRAAARAIGRTEVSITSLLQGVTSDHPNVIIQVPSASVMVTLDTAPHRVGTLAVYYECLRGDLAVDSLELLAVGLDQEVPEGAKLLGSFWYGGSLIAVYAKHVQP